MGFVQCYIRRRLWSKQARKWRSSCPYSKKIRTNFTKWPKERCHSKSYQDWYVRSSYRGLKVERLSLCIWRAKWWWENTKKKNNEYYQRTMHLVPLEWYLQAWWCGESKDLSLFIKLVNYRHPAIIDSCIVLFITTYST